MGEKKFVFVEAPTDVMKAENPCKYCMSPEGGDIEECKARMRAKNAIPGFAIQCCPAQEVYMEKWQIAHDDYWGLLRIIVNLRWG